MTNRLLSRQLRRHLGVANEDELRQRLAELGRHCESAPEGLRHLIAGIGDCFASVDDAYEHSERDLLLSQRSLGISSAELSSLNQQLREEAQVREQTLRALRDTTNRMLAPLGRSIREDDGAQSVTAHLDGLVADLLKTRSELEQTLDEIRKLSLVASSTTDLVIITDAHGCIEWVNKAFLDLTEYSIEEIQGRNPGNLLQGPNTDRDTVSRLGSAVRSATPIREEILNYSKSGKPYWVSINITPIFKPDGRVERFISIQSECTQRKIAETERLALESRVRESQKLEAVVQLTAGLAHDFNNLLAIVVGGLDEIGERLPEHDAALHQYHRNALEAAERGAEVTRSLLAVARRQPLEVAGFDVNVLLTELIPLCKTSAGSTVTLLSDLTAGMLPARLDAGGLANVVLNLVINARDALQGKIGEHRIMLRTRKAHVIAGGPEALLPGWYAVIEVADTGAGMDEQTRARAFEPFFTTKERGHGTGLGLAMVYGYVGQLGGTAHIQSKKGQGTTVQLYLPLDMDAQRKAAAAEATRLQALYDKKILDTTPEAVFDALVAEAARVCEVPIALVSLVDENRQWFKAKVGLEASQTPRDQAFCAHAITEPSGVLVVPDAHKDSRFSGNPLVTGEPRVRFYAGIVLRDAAGEALGTLCAIDHVPRMLNAVQLAQLEALAEQVAVLIRARATRTETALASAWRPPAARITTPSDRTDAPAARQRVLVVDDEQALCELACVWLESLGFETVGVYSPPAALERLAAGTFDFLFTDIMMPGDMNGIALAREAQSRQPSLQVVMASGYAKGLIDSPYSETRLITKPYRKNDLLKHFVAQPPPVG